MSRPPTPATSTPTHQQAGPGPAGDGATKVKVCGITEPAEIDLLAARAVDFVGLWYGVPGGPADLPLSDWRRARRGGRGHRALAPVMVTFLKDIEALREALEGSGVRWVQLHGYQTPGLVRAVKEISPDVRVLKVLHVRGGDCVEAPLDRRLREGRRRRLPVRRGGRGRPRRQHRRDAGPGGSWRRSPRGSARPVPARRRHLGRQPRRLRRRSPTTRVSSGSTSTPTRAAPTARSARRASRQSAGLERRGGGRRCLAGSPTLFCGSPLPVIMEVKRRDGHGDGADGRADDPGDRRPVHWPPAPPASRS